MKLKSDGRGGYVSEDGRWDVRPAYSPRRIGQPPVALGGHGHARILCDA